MTLVSLSDINAAAARIDGVARKTPVLRCEMLEAEAGLERLWWKCENLQATGAFKVRGAVNAVTKLTEDDASVGTFVCHSSGNHGQALALACKRAGKRAVVVVPRDAPSVKVAGLRKLGAEIVFCEPTQAAREATCAQVLRDREPAKLVHPYDEPLVIAGQGTIGLEILDACRNDGVDCVVVPVGGGGLISGIATAVKSINPSIRVVGAEPRNADDAVRVFHDPARPSNPVPHRPGMPATIGDGLRALLSRRTLAHIRENVDDIVAVPEEDMRAAMEIVLSQLKLVIEPSATVGAAVALLPQFRTHLAGRKRVAVVLCGGNVDLRRLDNFLPSHRKGKL